MNSDYIKIFTETYIIVRGLQKQLEDKGIHNMIKDKFESARLGGYGEQNASVELHVLNKDLEVVKPILYTYKAKIDE